MSTPSDDAASLPLTAYALVPPVTPFALGHAGLNNTNVGLRTGAGSFVARAYASPSYADPAAIAYEQRLLTWLAARELSFAMPVPLPTRGGALCCRGPHGWGALVAHRPRDGELLGAALGELHAALRHYPPAPRPGRPLFDTLFRFPGPHRDPLALVPAHLGLPGRAAP